MTDNDIYADLIDRLGYPPSGYLLRIMQKLVSADEGRMLLRLPAEPAQLAADLGLDEAAVRDRLQQFMQRGLVFPTSRGLCFARDVTQLHDAVLSSADRWVDTELLDLWRDFRQAEWQQSMAGQITESYMQFIRIVPARRAILNSPDVAADDLPPEEDILQMIRGADSIALVLCCCRRSMRRCDAPLDVCLQFNKGADYAIERGAGRRLSVEEAMEVAERAEVAGLIHTYPVRASGRLNEICNCCRDCCVVLEGALRFGTADRILQRSGFRAEVDAEMCIGCGDCVERCCFGAIEMDGLQAAIDSQKCFGCGLCAIVCEPGAIAMRFESDRGL